MANLEGTNYNATDDIYNQSEDIKLLKKNINEIFVKLDFESRAQLVKSIIKDITEKSNNINYSNQENKGNSVNFLSPEYDISNQRIILEKLSSIANTKKN